MQVIVCQLYLNKSVNNIMKTKEKKKDEESKDCSLSGKDIVSSRDHIQHRAEALGLRVVRREME